MDGDRTVAYRNILNTQLIGCVVADFAIDIQRGRHRAAFDGNIKTATPDTLLVHLHKMQHNAVSRLGDRNVVRVRAIPLGLVECAVAGS